MAKKKVAVDPEKVVKQEVGLEPMDTVTFLKFKKKQMKNMNSRKRFDALYYEVADKLINTNPEQSVTSGNNAFRWSFATSYNNGNFNVFPILRNQNTENITKVPNATEPVAFTKILIAAATLGGKVPDGTFDSDSKVFARAMYELWKRTWENRDANGETTLSLVYQYLFTYGWAAWRVYPREVVKKKGKGKKVVFDDIYRQPMDPYRTWLGAGVNNFDRFTRGEVLYEIDVEKADFFQCYPDAVGKKVNFLEVQKTEKKGKKNAAEKDLDDKTEVSQEAKDEHPETQAGFVTVTYYENELTNRYIVASGNYVIEDGELPNDDTLGHVEWANCFIRDLNDPYGVGIYELARGNAAMNDYISQMNAQQVEAEIYPLLFGNNVANAEMKYRRGPFVINPKMQGSAIDVVRTTGNVAQGIAFAERQKNLISENTGINDILAGQAGEGTLGSTVILKEAALQRLTIPRNTIVRQLESDAYKTVSWILQTYSIEKIEMFDTQDDVDAFKKMNPGLHVETKTKKKRDGTQKFISKYSPYTQVNFDFKGSKLMDRQSPIAISRAAVIQALKSSNNISDILLIKIDPNSMLIPSQEIKKQQLLELYTVTSAKTVELFTALQNGQGDLARALYTQLKMAIEAYREDVNKWIPKDLTDKIEASKGGMEPAPGLPGADGGALGGSMGLRPPTAGEIPAVGGPVRTGMGMSAPTQGARPANPMRDAVYASVGRAASGPRTNFIK